MFGKNKSAAYGYYGGVTKANHYVPGVTPINKDRYFLSQDLIRFLQQNASNIVLRQTLSSEPNNLDTFMLMTSGKPEDVIIYQSNNDVVVLDDVAGSGITSNTDDAIDGGTF